MSIPCDKDWIDVITAFAVPLVACIAGYIAYQQWKTNKRLLKHELFDRNLKVYEAILEFIGSVRTSGKANDKNLYNFNKETRVAKFLLDDDIVQVINEIYNKGVDLQTLDAELEGVPAGDKRSRIVKKKGEIKKWIYRQFGELDKKFENTLGLRDEVPLYKRLTRRLSRRKKHRSSA